MSSQRWPLAKTWTRWMDEAGGVGRGRGQRVGAVRVPDAEGDLDGLGVDEGRAAGQRDAADPRGCGGERAQRAREVLRVVPRRHVAGVAGCSSWPPRPPARRRPTGLPCWRDRGQRALQRRAASVRGHLSVRGGQGRRRGQRRNCRRQRAAVQL